MATSARRHPRLALAAGGAGGSGGGGNLPPGLRQAIRLLQLSRLELIEEIRKEMESAEREKNAAEDEISRGSSDTT